MGTSANTRIDAGMTTTQAIERTWDLLCPNSHLRGTPHPEYRNHFYASEVKILVDAGVLVQYWVNDSLFHTVDDEKLVSWRTAQLLIISGGI